MNTLRAGAAVSLSILTLAGCSEPPQTVTKTVTTTHLAGAKFAVYGTCLERGCGLKQRTGPGSNFPEVPNDDRLEDGTLVLVECQTSGLSPKGFNNRVWDKLDNGNFVSDALVDTPNRGGDFSEGLPRCAR